MPKPRPKARSPRPTNAARLSRELAAVGQRFYARGWALGTSGNYSAVVSRTPLRLAITSSGLNKRTLAPSHIIECGHDGRAAGQRDRKPSAETQLHVEIARRGAGAVLHTHSVWSTMLSERHAGNGGLSITGFEMLKGLHGVTSHEHRAWIPILDNDQDMVRLSGVVARTLDAHPDAHAFLLRRHGLYTWGATLEEAERHVEILEFLFEVIGRQHGAH